MTQNEGAVNGFLKPHLLQISDLPGLARLTKLITITKPEIAKTKASPNSKGGFSIFVMVVVIVVEDCGRLVVYDVACSTVLVLVKVLGTVALPVSVTKDTDEVVFVIFVVVEVLVMEVDVTVLVAVAVVEETVDGLTSKCATALLELPQ